MLIFIDTDCAAERAERLEDLTGELQKVRDEQERERQAHHQQIEALKAEHGREIDTLKSEVQIQIEKLDASLVQERKANEAQETKLSDMLIDADKMVSAAEATKNQARKEIEDLHEQRKAAAQEVHRAGEKIARIEAERDECRKEAKAAAIENAKLAGKVETLQAQLVKPESDAKPC